MPVLRQDESYLIGTAQAIKALEKRIKPTCLLFLIHMVITIDFMRF